MNGSRPWKYAKVDVTRAAEVCSIHRTRIRSYVCNSDFPISLRDSDITGTGNQRTTIPNYQRNKAKMSVYLKTSLETILLVDDNAAVLKVVGVMLKRAGFAVLSAINGKDATQLVTSFPGAIHLLLSDVDMPDILGSDLATRLTALRPELLVILMSGRADGALLRFNDDWQFISKPFLPESLVRMVKDLLKRRVTGNQNETSKDHSSTGSTAS